MTTTTLKTRILDLHCDTLDLLAWPILDADLRGGQSMRETEHGSGLVAPGPLADIETSDGHLTLAAASGMSWLQCMAVFVFDTLTVEQQVRFFDQVSATLPQHAAAHSDRMGVARTMDQAEALLDQGKFAAFLTIEGAGLLAAGDHMVDRIDQAGVRMVTLTWNAANPLGSGHNTHQGLTELGRKRIRELEEHRIAVDVSHLNDEGFADLLHVARRPFAASHSNSRTIQGHLRNLTDDQFRAIRDAGGVAGINYYVDFVAPGRDYAPEALLRHIEHWLDLDGENTVALGSDFDGCTCPAWLRTCADVQTLADMLASHFGQDIANKICYDNAAAFFRRIEAA